MPNDAIHQRGGAAAEAFREAASGIARLVVALAIAVAGTAAPATPARAQTIDELNAAIASIEADMAQREAAVEAAKAALAESVRDSYKSGGTGAEQSLSAVLDADGMEALISNAQYADSLSRKHAQAVADARVATAELEGARDELMRLREEAIAREEAKLNRDSGEYHYCQWGESYSDIRYFCGTIASAGCGLCAYTTMVNLLIGTHYMPDEMLAIRGDWNGQEELLDLYPSHAEWTREHFDIDMTLIPDTVADARAALSEDETVLIVCSGGTVFHDKAGNFRYSDGHYVVAYRCDDGGFYVHDSSYKGDDGTAVYYTDAEFDAMMIRADRIVKCSN